MLLINTSVKQDNNTQRVITGVQACLQKHPASLPVDVAQVTPVPTFHGDYYTVADQLPAAARTAVQQLQQSRDHLYFVPTYYKSMPGAFKNMLDGVRIASVYTGKRIGIVSTNAKNQDYGARQFMQSLLGLLEFHQAVSVIVPQILILSPDEIDCAALTRYLDYYTAFPAP